MFFNLAWRNSKRNRSENLIYFLTIPASDLPFVFDKGFTGDVGSYLSRSTGMGLYLVQQMASDLTIKIDIHSNTNGGTTVILTFPKVERPLGR